MIRKPIRLSLRLTLLLCLAALGSLSASAQEVTILHSFGDGTVASDGGSPVAPLVLGTDGDFYGTTQGGGSAGQGTVFQMTPEGTVTTLTSFLGPDGSQPLAGLVQGADGNFYGTTWDGGASGAGTVYQITPTGTLTTLHNFTATSVTRPNGDGANPWAALTIEPNGMFLGTTQSGGTPSGAATTPNAGTVFAITPAGTLTTDHVFGNGSADGAVSHASVILGTDGNFYGTTWGGGASGQGTVFRMTQSGAVTTLVSFNGANGAYPAASLAQGPDGNFYGTTTAGGSAGSGTIVRVTPSGALTTLYSFSVLGGGGANDDGACPQGALVLASDGNFYGTTSTGGSAGGGTVFQITPTGHLTTLHMFGDGSVDGDGLNPQAALTVGPDGSLYGTTFAGGSAGGGTVFQVSGLGTVAVPVWNARDTAAAPDGSARILWTRSDGAAGIWTMNNQDAQTAAGPVYGPYAAWTAKAVSLAGDGSARLLWIRTDGAAQIWSLDGMGTAIVKGPVDGPYPGWSATDLAAAPDGSCRVLWTNANGAAGVWTVDESGTTAVIGPAYGPFPGWTAKAVGAAGDGTARVLWTNANGAAGIWTLDAADSEVLVGPSYGPFRDGLGAWSAAGLGTSAYGVSQVLWSRTDGAAGLWTFSAADAAVAAGPAYGPFPGFTATATDAASGQPRILWVRADRAAGLWSFGATDAVSTIGTVYGPF